MLANSRAAANGKKRANAIQTEFGNQKLIPLLDKIADAAHGFFGYFNAQGTPQNGAIHLVQLQKLVDCDLSLLSGLQSLSTGANAVNHAGIHGTKLVSAKRYSFETGIDLSLLLYFGREMQQIGVAGNELLFVVGLSRYNTFFTIRLTDIIRLSLCLFEGLSGSQRNPKERPQRKLAQRPVQPGMSSMAAERMQHQANQPVPPPCAKDQSGRYVLAMDPVIMLMNPTPFADAMYRATSVVSVELLSENLTGYGSIARISHGDTIAFRFHMGLDTPDIIYLGPANPSDLDQQKLCTAVPSIPVPPAPREMVQDNLSFITTMTADTGHHTETHQQRRQDSTDTGSMMSRPGSVLRAPMPGQNVPVYAMPPSMMNPVCVTNQQLHGPNAAASTISSRQASNGPPPPVFVALSTQAQAQDSERLANPSLTLTLDKKPSPVQKKTVSRQSVLPEDSISVSGSVNMRSKFRNQKHHRQHDDDDDTDDDDLCSVFTGTVMSYSSRTISGTPYPSGSNTLDTYQIRKGKFDTLPLRITHPGVYRLDASVVISQSALDANVSSIVSIEASGVIFDLGGHKLEMRQDSFLNICMFEIAQGVHSVTIEGSGQSQKNIIGHSSLDGIRIVGQSRGILVRNLSIENFSRHGISAVDSSGIRILGVQFTSSNCRSGISLVSSASTLADDVLIEDCTFDLVVSEPQTVDTVIQKEAETVVPQYQLDGIDVQNVRGLKVISCIGRRIHSTSPLQSVDCSLLTMQNCHNILVDGLVNESILTERGSCVGIEADGQCRSLRIHFPSLGIIKSTQPDQATGIHLHNGIQRIGIRGCSSDDIGGPGIICPLGDLVVN